ncbi:MAG: alpha/beta fold hydrolase [Chloroflexi bacterium AL-W]|nr:alpha/beta fold hydrolase [Chloroflexi bacterium AL-N1]NOK69625.1 alpha/beta fold hydrolase [Chloroflexi bacterium AL-N10]NOK72172.1 alpha/beta fold hydrolase [Chloroflexi bacterium AL-N5]NOK85001.1 alpha/beta fold hydrolase [Chloroflexi bacterium AL-W]
MKTLFSSISFTVGVGLGMLSGRIGYVGSHLTQLLIMGNRQPFWITPSDLGMSAEEVEFPSRDGIMLRGWFIPRASSDGSPAPTIVFVHGWPWNRLGNRAGSTLIHDQSVDFLGPAKALHEAGFNVLLFDLRNHGTSDTALPVTMGVHEARDFADAVAMLRQRNDVAGGRIGAIGYSMGANSLIYGIPLCQPICAAIAIQPVRITTFARNFTRMLLGPIGPSLFNAAVPLHRALGGPPLTQVNPASVAYDLGETEVLYVQGSGDRWGTLEDVQAMADATPHTHPVVVVPSTERYGGYHYVNEQIDSVIAFFQQRLVLEQVVGGDVG